MSNNIRVYPQDKYRFELYDNVDGLTRQQIQRKKKCYALVNLWYFSLSDQPAANVKYWDHQNGGVMLRGKWEYEKYDYPGICISKDGYVTTGNKSDAAWDYAASVQADYIKGVKSSNISWGRNGVTYTGLTRSGDVAVLVVSKDTGLTSAQALDLMLRSGCVDILRWDGSWSSQGNLGNGIDIQPSKERKVRGWLLIYEREEESKMPNKTVCLDPGHGPGCVNGSPDGTYKEYEFAWDMCNRIADILRNNSVQVVITKNSEGYPSLTERARTSNNAKANLLVSLHSNASGDGKSWTSPSGLCIYTTAAGEAAGRNKAANAVLDSMKAAGVKLFSSGLFHSMLTVLAKADAPAILIEYGFHTNAEDTANLKSAEYRDKLAKATAKGICYYLGLDCTSENNDQGTDEVAAWAASAWASATKSGILNGTRPTEGVTRQELAVVLDRAGLI